MKVLEGIESKLFVAIDIETVRFTNTFDELDPAFQSAWSYKNKQDGVVPTHEELSDLWIRQASLYAEFSKVCAVSIAFLDSSGDKLVCVNIGGADEPTVLVELADWLARISKGNPSNRLIGHASNYFDYPFLCKRYIINGMDIPKILDDSDKKPWEKLNQDTNTLWKCGGTGPGSSLQALCTVLNIPVSKVDMVGDEVGQEYFKGNIEGIKTYCGYDAIATFNVLRRYKKESIFQFDDVVYVGATEDGSIADTPVLNRLYMTKEFSDDIKEELKDAILSKKVLKKEWPMLEKIVADLYVETAMFKADTLEVQERKRAEIQLFFEELQKEYKK